MDTGGRVACLRLVHIPCYRFGALRRPKAPREKEFADLPRNRDSLLGIIYGLLGGDGSCLITPFSEAPSAFETTKKEPLMKPTFRTQSAAKDG